MHSTYGYPSANHLNAHPQSLPTLSASSPYYSLYNGASPPPTPNPSLAHIRLDDESSFGFFDPPPITSNLTTSGGIPPPSQLYHTPSLGSTFSFDAPPTSYPLTASTSGGGGGGGGSLASPVLDLPLYSEGFPSAAAPYNSPVPLSTFSSSLTDVQQQPYPLMLSTSSVQQTYQPALASPLSSSHYSYPSSHKRSRSDAIPSSAAAIKAEDGVLSLQSFASPTDTAPSYPSFPVQSVPALPAYVSPVAVSRRSVEAPPRTHSSASMSSSSGSSQADHSVPQTPPEPPAKRSHASPTHTGERATSSNSGNNQRPVLRTAEERSAWRKKKHREMDAWRRKKETAVVERFAALSGQQEEKVEEKRDRVTTLEVACERYASLIDHVKGVEDELRREKERVASLAQEVGMLRMAARERDGGWEGDDDSEAADSDYDTWKRARQARKEGEHRLIPTGNNNNNDASPRSPISPTPSSPTSEAASATTTATTATSSGSRRVLLDHLIHYHHSHVLYSSLFLHSSQMMLIISTSTARFLDISESFLSRTGFQRSDIIGKIFWGPYSVLSTLQPMPPPPRVDFSDRPPVLNDKGEVVPAPIGAEQLASTKRSIGELWRGEKDSVSCVWRMAFKTRDYEVRTMCWMGRGSQKVKGVGRDREKVEDAGRTHGMPKETAGLELAVRRAVGGAGASEVTPAGSGGAVDYTEETLYEELRRMKVEDAEEEDQLMPTELIMATTPSDIVPIERRDMYNLAGQ